MLQSFKLAPKIIQSRMEWKEIFTLHVPPVGPVCIAFLGGTLSNAVVFLMKLSKSRLSERNIKVNVSYSHLELYCLEPFTVALWTLHLAWLKNKNLALSISFCSMYYARKVGFA